MPISGLSNYALCHCTRYSFPYAHSFVGGSEPCLKSDSMIFLTQMICENFGLADKPLLEIELEDSSIY